jgi:hypothetical protein
MTAHGPFMSFARLLLPPLPGLNLDGGVQSGYLLSDRAVVVPRPKERPNRNLSLTAIAALDCVSESDDSGGNLAPGVPTNRRDMPPMLVGVEVLEVPKTLRESLLKKTRRPVSRFRRRSGSPNILKGAPSCNPVRRQTQEALPPGWHQVARPDKLTNVPCLVIDESKAVCKEPHDIGC